MKNLLLLPVFALTCLLSWGAPTPSFPQHAIACGGQTAASGTFTQTGITSLEVRPTPGGSVILDQTSEGTVSGTISGTYEDSLIVVIRPNGTFSASFSLEVDGTVDGIQGTLTLQAADVGQLTGPTTATFSGVAAITGASGGLAGMTGVLEIEGTVDLVSGLSTYAYEGTLLDAE